MLSTCYPKTDFKSMDLVARARFLTDKFTAKEMKVYARKVITGRAVTDTDVTYVKDTVSQFSFMQLIFYLADSMGSRQGLESCQDLR
jgi:hypothetical protein